MPWLVVKIKFRVNLTCVARRMTNSARERGRDKDTEMCWDDGKNNTDDGRGVAKRRDAASCR